MENYMLLGIKSRKSKKTDKNYNIAYLSLETDYDFQIIPVMIQEKQVDVLIDVIGDLDFDISEYLKLRYNAYNKKYELTITYGL